MLTLNREAIAKLIAHALNSLPDPDAGEEPCCSRRCAGRELAAGVEVHAPHPRVRVKGALSMRDPASAGGSVPARGEGRDAMATKKTTAEGFTCSKCDTTSYHPEDVRQGYCGRCHLFQCRLCGVMGCEARCFTP